MMRSPEMDTFTKDGALNMSEGFCVVHALSLSHPSRHAKKFHLIRQELVAPIKLWHSQAL